VTEKVEVKKPEGGSVLSVERGGVPFPRVGTLDRALTTSGIKAALRSASGALYSRQG
jgi:hypothetical protein